MPSISNRVLLEARIGNSVHVQANDRSINSQSTRGPGFRKLVNSPGPAPAQAKTKVPSLFLPPSTNTTGKKQKKKTGMILNRRDTLACSVGSGGRGPGDSKQSFLNLTRGVDLGVRTINVLDVLYLGPFPDKRGSKDPVGLDCGANYRAFCWRAIGFRYPDDFAIFGGIGGDGNAAGGGPAFGCRFTHRLAKPAFCRSIAGAPPPDQCSYVTPDYFSRRFGIPAGEWTAFKRAGTKPGNQWWKVAMGIRVFVRKFPQGKDHVGNNGPMVEHLILSRGGDQTGKPRRVEWQIVGASFHNVPGGTNKPARV